MKIYFLCFLNRSGIYMEIFCSWYFSHGGSCIAKWLDEFHCHIFQFKVWLKNWFDHLSSCPRYDYVSCWATPYLLIILLKSRRFLKIWIKIWWWHIKQSDLELGNYILSVNISSHGHFMRDYTLTFGTLLWYLDF